MGQRREKLAGRSPSSGAAVEVAGAENRDGAVLAVVTRLATYLPAADPDDGLGEHAAACTADFAERNMAEYGQLRSECGHQPGHFGGYLLALGSVPAISAATWGSCTRLMNPGSSAGR